MHWRVLFVRNFPIISWVPEGGDRQSRAAPLGGVFARHFRRSMADDALDGLPVEPELDRPRRKGVALIPSSELAA